MMRKIRNKIGKDEPILQKVSDIYAEDIYAESASNPTSRFDNTQDMEQDTQKEVEMSTDEMKAFKPWDN